MAMVEFVFILPLLLLILFAIIESGIILTRWVTLNNAVREGARDAIHFNPNCTPAGRMAEVQARVASYAQSGGVTIAPGDVDVTGQLCEAGEFVTVSADWTYNFFVLHRFRDGVGTFPLHAESTMRNEG
jgi:Flp pilus assembly protein TadG